jgi:hypothetical protein
MVIKPDIHQWSISGRSIDCMKYLVDNGYKLRIEDVECVCRYRGRIDNHNSIENKKKIEQESYDIFTPLKIFIGKSGVLNLQGCKYTLSHCFCKVHCKTNICTKILSRVSGLKKIINTDNNYSKPNQKILKYLDEIAM